MSIRVCGKGHVTGYKECPQCGSISDKQIADHSEFPGVKAARLKREKEEEDARRNRTR